MQDKFEALCARYEELQLEQAQPETACDAPRLSRVTREIARLRPAVEDFRRYQAVERELEEANTLLSDPDFALAAQEELAALQQEQASLEAALKAHLIPKDEMDDRSVIMEIRPAAGGEEAALVAADLLRMYRRYAERRGFRAEIIDLSGTELGGVKEAVFSVNGFGAYARLKYESGVHRIQRVPITETAGRIHTSTATVAVLPEAEDVEVEIRSEDIRVDTYRASGHGGQYINRTDSAVRLTHLPTGLVVTCQDEKSQLKNKEKAMKVLRSRLYDLYRAKSDSEYAEKRRSQVGSGERNERIRSYNYHENRVTDHRVGLTLYKLDAVLDGDLDAFIDALAMQEQGEKLKRLEGTF